MKRILTIFLTLTLFISLLELNNVTYAVKNDNTKSDDSWTYTLDTDGNAQLTSYKGSNKQLNIPKQIDGKTVVSIATSAFYNSEIERVTLPPTIKEIGWWAFYGCKYLNAVTLDEGLKTIGYGAFMNCPSLVCIDIPMSINEIGEDAFAVDCVVQKDVFDYYSKNKISTQKYSVDSSFKISGYSGTYAEKYANDNNLDFISMGTIKYGDVNSDNVVNQKDIELIKNYISSKINLIGVQFYNADVDNDEKITNNDIKLINEYINNDISYYSFPSASNLTTPPDYLSGKSIYCDGDSIAKGTGTNIQGYSFYSYCHYLAEKYNMNMVNNAVGGTTIAKRKEVKKESEKSILERVKKISGSYDFIILDGGYNDLFKKVNIGKVTEDSDKSGNYDEYTTAGALESICYFLQENYKDSIKLFVIGHKRYANPEQETYWKVIRKVLDKWGIDYIDLSQETQLCDVNDEISTQYFKFKEGKGDGIHPLRYTNQKIYGPVVAKKLNYLAGQKAEFSMIKTNSTIGLFDYEYITPDFSAFSGLPELTWSSDNTSVAEVDKYGLVKAKEIGSVVIKACTTDGKVASLNVNVRLIASDLKISSKLTNVIGSRKMSISASGLNN